MAGKRLRISQEELIKQHICAELFNSSSKFKNHLKLLFRGSIISKKEQESLYKLIPSSLKKTAENFIKEHNRSITENNIKNHQKSITSKLGKNNTQTNSSNYQIGQRIKCKASDFKISKGVIKYKTLTLNTVRVKTAFKAKLLSAIEETFTIVVESHEHFHFEPYTDLSRILSCCIAEKLRLQRLSVLKKGTSLLDITLYKVKEEIQRRILQLMTIDIDIPNIINYYDEDTGLFKSWSPTIYEGVGYSTICKFIKDPSKITAEQLFFSTYINKVLEVCNEFHLDSEDGIFNLEIFINEQITKLKKHIESVRIKFFRSLFEEKKERISTYISHNYKIKFSSSDCLISDDNLIVDKENVNIETTGSITELNSEIYTYAKILNFNASSLIAELENLLKKEYDDITQKLFAKNRLIISTGISQNNLNILLPIDNKMSIALSKTPKLNVYIPKPNFNLDSNYDIIHLKGNMTNRFLTRGSVCNISLASLFSSAISYPDILCGELFNFNRETHSLWLRFVNSTFGKAPKSKLYLDYYACLRIPIKYYAPAFLLSHDYFNNNFPEKHRHIQRYINVENSVYLIYENYSHLSDKGSGKPNFATYLELSKRLIKIIPSDPESAIHILSDIPDLYTDLALYGIIRYFTSPLCNKRQMWPYFRNAFSRFLWNLRKNVKVVK